MLVVVASSIYSQDLGHGIQLGIYFLAIVVYCCELNMPSLYIYACDVSVIIFVWFLSSTGLVSFGRHPGTLHA